MAMTKSPCQPFVLAREAPNSNDVRFSAMEPIGNDRWRGQFTVPDVGRYRYTIEGWVDHFQTWRMDLTKRIASGQDVSLDMLIGAGFVEAAASRAAKR